MLACSSYASARAAGQEAVPMYPSGPAAAQSHNVNEVQRSRFDDHPLALELRVGAASATGLIGLVLEYNVHERFVLNAGMGTNLLGISSAFGARVRPVVGASRNGEQLHAFVMETSISRSAYQGDWIGEQFFCDDRCVRSRYVGWAQAELGWEARIGHLQLHATLGAAFLLGDPQFSCRHEGFDSPANCDSSQSVARVLLAQTVGAGYAF